MIKIDVSIDIEAKDIGELSECNRLVRDLLRELGDRRIKVASARASSREVLIELHRDLKEGRRR